MHALSALDSPDCQFHLLHLGMLFFRQLAEELDLLLGGWLPVIIRLERRLQVCFDVHIKGLGLQLRIRRVVHTRNDLRRSQVMQVRR